MLALLPALSVPVLWIAQYEHASWLTRARDHLPHIVAYVSLAAALLVLFALAATFTFATAAAQNAELHPLKRMAWVIALLMVGPLSAPLYWALYLRE